MNAASGLFLCGALAFLNGEIYRHNDWRDVTPVIQSEVRRLELPEMKSLLARLCVGGLRYVDKVGVKCSTKNPGTAFDDIVDNQFHPVAVVYGHFLSSSSEDAAVSGWSNETHPALWAGTLLLTRRNGEWIPVWYKSSVITHSCQKVTTPGGREMLVCEYRDGGMGHRIHSI